MIDPGRIGFGESSRFRVEVVDLAVGLPAKTHLTHEEIDGEVCLVIGEALRDPALADDPGHDHLNQTIGGMHGPEGACEGVVVRRPKLGDAISGPGGLEIHGSDGGLPSLAGELHCGASGLALDMEHISEEGSLACRLRLDLQ